MFDRELKEGLMQSLEFTPDDLEANRNGTMSEAQKVRMSKNAGITRVFTLIMFVVMILVFAGIGAYLFVFTDNGKTMLSGFAKEPTMLYIIGGVLALVILIIFFSFLRTLASTNGMAAGNVSVAEGNAKVKSMDTRYGTSFTIQIGKTKFYVQDKVFNNFAEGQPYRVYYVKSTMPIMLSAEML